MNYDNSANKKANILQNQKLAIKKYIEGLDEEQKMKFWIKTLLSSYSTFPEIIKTLDKIIELQATTISFSSDIYNKEGSACNQIERVIDLTERKSFLVNIYVMTKNLISDIQKDKFLFLEKRFMFNWTTEDLAREYGVSTRTIYRRIEKILDEIYESAINKKITLRLIESQLKSESWLKERFIKQITEYYKTCFYQIEKDPNYNQSSSMS